MSLITENNKKELILYEGLKKVIDPEVGISIIDMGLVYNIKYQDSGAFIIEMTLSTKACPLGDIIRADVEKMTQELFPDVPLTLKMVWEPVWSPNFMTPAGKKALGR
jgi:metal-sulfur cluster biosynthetic enzyme